MYLRKYFKRKSLSSSLPSSSSSTSSTAAKSSSSSSSLSVILYSYNLTSILLVFMSFINLVISSDTLLSNIYYRNLYGSSTNNNNNNAYGYKPLNGQYTTNNNNIVNNKIQRYQLAKELGEQCISSGDCRENAYQCSPSGICECAEGYKPDELMATCVGAIGRKCMYDNHCIPRAYCKGQTICTCKREYPIISSDEWSCEESSSKVIQVSSFLLILNIIILFILLF